MRTRGFWTAAALSVALVLVGGAPAVAAVRGPEGDRLIDLGVADLVAMNDRGDLVGIDSSCTAVLWRHDTYAAVNLGVGCVYGPMAVNNHGAVVGHLGDGRGFLFRDGALKYLQHPSRDAIFPSAINDRGQVAGIRTTAISQFPYIESRPFSWQGGVFTDLGSWGGVGNGLVAGINSRGQVAVNLYNTDSTVQRAFVWHRGTLTDLGSLGGNRTWATDINDSGAIVGHSEDADGNTHPFLWRAGRMKDLLPGGGSTVARVDAVNAAGAAVGHVDGRPALWHASRLIELLPPGDEYGYSVDINNRGDVAGITYRLDTADNILTPFRWRNGRLSYLNNLADYPGTRLVGIDRRGRVAGVSNAVGGAQHAVVWVSS